MRFYLFSFFFFVVFFVRSQLDISASGLFNKPISNFCNDEYNKGWGTKYGLGYTHIYDQRNIGFEVGWNWLSSGNGYKEAALPLGDYFVMNKWSQTQFKINAVWELYKTRAYIGLSRGSANYKSTEYIDFEVTQEDGSDSWDGSLFSKRVMQYGAQAGMYYKVSKNWSFDLGFSIQRAFRNVKFINLNSYVFDGVDIFYDEPRSKPFLITISAGFRLKLFDLKEAKKRAEENPKSPTLDNPSLDSGTSSSGSGTSTSGSGTSSSGSGTSTSGSGRSTSGSGTSTSGSGTSSSGSGTSSSGSGTSSSGSGTSSSGSGTSSSSSGTSSSGSGTSSSGSGTSTSGSGTSTSGSGTSTSGTSTINVKTKPKPTLHKNGKTPVNYK